MSCREMVLLWLRYFDVVCFDNVTYTRTRKVCNDITDMYLNVMREIVVCSCCGRRCQFCLVVARYHL